MIGRIGVLIVISLFWSISLVAFAQSKEDLKRIEKTIVQRTYQGQSFYHPKQFRWSGNPFLLLARGGFHIYQRHLTQQLATACPYHPSCSEFSRLCFQQFHPLKAFALTTDRLTRCTKLHFTADKINLQFKNQRWVDLPDYYYINWQP